MKKVHCKVTTTSISSQEFNIWLELFSLYMYYFTWHWMWFGEIWCVRLIIRASLQQQKWSNDNRQPGTVITRCPGTHQPQCPIAPQQPQAPPTWSRQSPAVVGYCEKIMVNFSIYWVRMSLTPNLLWETVISRLSVTTVSECNQL